MDFVVGGASEVGTGRELCTGQLQGAQVAAGSCTVVGGGCDVCAGVVDASGAGTVTSSTSLALGW